jgi:hypothetical protein
MGVGTKKYLDLMREVEEVRKTVRQRSAWRIDGTLREFPKFPPVNLWFDYPVHHVDTVGSLMDVEAEGEAPPWKRALEARKPKEAKATERRRAVDVAYEACGIDGEVTLKSISEYMDVTQKTGRNRIEEHGSFEIKAGVVKRKIT